MTYFSNLEKKMNDNNREPKISKSKLVAIILTIVASIGYFSLFTNLLGFVKYFLLGIFGIFAYAIFTTLFLVSGMLLKGKKYNISKSMLIALSFALFSIIAIFHMSFSGIDVSAYNYGSYLSYIYNMQASVGGLLFGLVIYPLQKFLNFGAYIFFAIILVVCVTIIYNKIAENKSLSKIDFKLFKKNDNKTATKKVAQKEEKTKTITINTAENELQSQQNQGVGINAEVSNELSSREIARRKLGLDRINQNSNDYNPTTNQLDIFNKNYMNSGGTVFSSKNYAENYSGTFGFNSSQIETKKSAVDEDMYSEYRKFMGLDKISPEQTYSPSNNAIFNDNSQNHESTESKDEELFGTPKSTSIKFNYNSPSEQVDYLDKISNQSNEEVKIDGIETEEQKENNLNEIFDNNFPQKEIDLPKSFQNNDYSYTKKFDISSKNPIDYQINRKNEELVESLQNNLPKQKIPLYRYTKPTIDLLTTESTDPNTYGGDVEETGHKIEEVLEEFKIPAKVIGITRGPAVTRYELEMPVGISVSKIPSLENDIAMRIATTKKIRIQVPIPGMRAFGIEVPNDKVATVSLKDVLQSEAFKTSKSPCAFGLGKELNGVIDICSVNKMPHVLIAGSTGSGKSVCLNCLILSILYKSSPEDVRFILIDPKRVEFSMYAGLPHLIIPDIICEPKKADNALGWAINEMEKRLELLKQYKVKDIDSYNSLQEVKDRYLPKMPYIIIIMDEFADMMQSECKDIENKVARLAAKARAAGIHLVLATQRPSVDVLSGTAKNNFPARIAFFLTSQTDSRTILGYGGAENLLGRGDMLYSAPGSNEGLKRLQGCYVSEDEIKSVVEYVISHNESIFDENVENEFNKSKEAETVNPDGTFASFDEEYDEEAEMHEYAKNVMKEFIRIGRASASYIQRTQRVGFVKAGRIMDYLEKKRYISQGDGSQKARAVYMTKEQYIEIFGDTDFDNYD